MMSSHSQASPGSRDAGSTSGGGGPEGPPKVAVVAAGAGARGAYEAGALSVLVPWLHGEGKAPSIFVGTSAGAINAALFAAVAHLDPVAGAKQVLDVWRSLRLHDVFASPIGSFPLTTAPKYVGQALGLPGVHVGSLLETTPLRETAERLFKPHAQALHDNIHGPAPVVDALAVVATDDRDRTTVFVDLRDGLELPADETARAIDYEQAAVTAQHVLASSAIPVLFPSVSLNGHWYWDGGVRLNVPLKPAIDLGATELAVVATHPARYEDGRPAAQPRRTHDVVDGIVAVLGAVLADRMVEDLYRLGTINELLPADDRDAERRRIPYVFVGPESRRELGDRAADVYRQGCAGRTLVDEVDLRLLRRLIGPREDGGGDLLSYIFFDHSYMDDLIALGIRHASAAISAGAMWRTARPSAGHR